MVYVSLRVVYQAWLYQTHPLNHSDQPDHQKTIAKGVTLVISQLWQLSKTATSSTTRHSHGPPSTKLLTPGQKLARSSLHRISSGKPIQR
ncbi:hypothetical protein J6590_032462 [Homalodisca vitripennis]|nr:hypothetical protein J6590_032462 [Homalodisca vitripennis]